jgi:hypothetical protein
VSPAKFTLDLDAGSAYRILLLAIAGVGLLIGLLAWLGILGWRLGLFQTLVHATIHFGFGLWWRSLSWMPCPVLLLVVLALLGPGAEEEPTLQGSALVRGLALGIAGLVSCLAYVYIDLERNEVARDFKALHNRLRGQALAQDLLQYGHRVGVFLLVVASIAVIGGFALTNYMLYDAVAPEWYRLSDDKVAAENSRAGFQRLPRFFADHPVQRRRFVAHNQLVPIRLCQLRSPGALARFGAADALQVVLHTRAAAAGLRVGASGQAAVRNGERLLGAGTSASRARRSFVAAVRPVGRPTLAPRPALSCAAPGRACAPRRRQHWPTAKTRSASPCSPRRVKLAALARPGAGACLPRSRMPTRRIGPRRSPQSASGRNCGRTPRPSC